MFSHQVSKKIVVLGTGGTIAGVAGAASDNIGYTAAQLGVAQLLANVPGVADVLKGACLLVEQVAQVDSKDMRFDIWVDVARLVQSHLTCDDVAGVVITHGTDTLEETAFFLQSVLSEALLAAKPVVLTCAMRPATAILSDGPQNLLDALALVLTPQASGVMVVCASKVHSAQDVQKVHTYRLDAFDSGDAGLLGWMTEGTFKPVKNWPIEPTQPALAEINHLPDVRYWPRVEVIMNYAGASAWTVDALLRAHDGVPPLRGLVVAGTGNGTIHEDLCAALCRAQNAGVKVVRATRCVNGPLLDTDLPEFAHSKGLSPVKARIALMLALMREGCGNCKCAVDGEC